MMSKCLTRFPISGLGEPNIYHDSGMFYKEVGILLGGCLTVKNLWWFLTGDDEVGSAIILFDIQGYDIFEHFSKLKKV